MNRRTTLAGIADAILPEGDGTSPLAVSPFANKQLPRVQRPTAGLEPYAGPWGKAQVLHLLRRTAFGPTRAHIDDLLPRNVSSAVDVLLSPAVQSETFPLITDSRDTAPVGSTWVYEPAQAEGSTFNPSGIRTTSLKAWWMGLIVDHDLSIREKMVLFWHNHFVTERADVGDPRFIHRYVALLRRHTLGNWKDLTRAMTTDGAMLRYLNGNTNTRTSPNENYGRELQELFTVGKGPEVAPGDYTFYTEDDVKAAARVLTGWQEDATQLTVAGGTPWKFTTTRHDTADKQFSARYGGRVITGGTDGARELDDLLGMIFAQEETAKHLCRKLYRWFVYYDITPEVEDAVIRPMADILRGSNYEVVPPLAALLRSAHFYDPLSMGCMIKSPIDFVSGIVRQFSVPLSATLANRYAMLATLVSQASAMQQNLGDPPGVAGWAAYYQVPQFHELWINSDTLPRRTRFADVMVRSGYSYSGERMRIDILGFTQSLPGAGDPNVLVDTLAELLYAIPLTANQKAFLKNTLIPGLPDYEWTVEWNAYLADPTNTTKQNAVRGKLQTLLSLMTSMPEFHLH